MHGPEHRFLIRIKRMTMIFDFKKSMENQKRFTSVVNVFLVSIN